ncbi:MAG: nitronate monooxygenase [Burkholderiales bacterium]|nr:nitronate monooxygenase [Burkholderiales bacterium]
MKNIFNSKYPIIQAPMAGGIINPQFVATVCNSGIIGFIPAGYLSILQLEEFIINVKSLLKPNTIFGVNIFIEQFRQSNIIDKPKYLIDIEKELNYKSTDQVQVPASISENDYIDLLIKHSVKMVSCTFGFFNSKSIQRLKEYNIKIIGNATNIEEFEYCIKHKADAIVIQGTEAGGHQASFMNERVNLTTTKELLTQIRKVYPSTIIISSGGISTSNYKEFLNLGADYVQLGTAFMLTHESSLSEIIKQFIIISKNTTLNNKITGKYARGVQNKLMEVLDLETVNHHFPIQHYITTEIRKYAKSENNYDFMSLWVGSNPDNFNLQSLEDLIKTLTN